MKDSPISTTVDFEKDGVQHGFLKLPYSHDNSAWGSIVIPITVVKNGDGPTILFTGANHGDEYEGPVALFDLANNINSEDVQRKSYYYSRNELSSFSGCKKNISN